MSGPVPPSAPEIADEPAARGFGEELRRVLALAGPLTLGHVAGLAMLTVDTLFVGRHDPREMAAVAIGSTWLFAVQVVAIGVLFALDPVLGQAHGARDRAAVGAGLRDGLWAALLLSLPVMALHLAAPLAFTLAEQPAAVIPIAVRFCRVYTISVPFALAFVVLRQYLAAVGRPRAATVALVAANGLNALVDYCFVIGGFGFPALGATGAAVATCTSQVFQLLFAAWLARDLLREAFAGVSLRFDAARVGALLRVGAPLGLQIGLEVWAFNSAAVMAGWLGEDELAAHAAALNMASLTFMLPLGVSGAAAARVGNLLGAGRPWGRTVLAAYLVGVGAMSVGVVAFSLFPGLLAALYSQDPAVQAGIVAVLPVAAAFQLFDGTQVVGFGVLRGAGDTRVPMFANVLGFYCLGLPFGYWLAFEGGMGLAGLWRGLAVGLATVAVLILLRVRQTWGRGGYAVRLPSAH